MNSNPKGSLSYFTISWVALAHLIVIGLFLGTFSYSKPKPREQWVELVPIGNLNPANGTPSPSQTSAPGTQTHARMPSQPRTTSASSSVPASRVIQQPTPHSSSSFTHRSPIPQHQPLHTESLHVQRTGQTERAERTPVEVSTRLVTRPVKPSQPAASGTQAANHVSSPSSGKSSTSGEPTATQPQSLPASGSSEEQKPAQEIGMAGGTGTGAWGSPDGEASEQARYHALIKDAITRHWQRPRQTTEQAASPENRLETAICVRIQPDGTLEFVEISNPSGNAEMDDSVRQAAESVGKLPEPLPAGLGAPDYEVTIQFKLES